jgi:membrane protein
MALFFFKSAMQGLHFKNSFKILKMAFKEWMQKDPFRQSAIIAYYSIFSLPALLVIIIATAGLFFGREAVSGKIYEQISGMIGPDTAKQVENMIAEASKTKDSIWATIIGLITLLIGATGVFEQLQKTLNIIWEVKADENKKGIWPLIKARLFSFGLILSIGFLLLVSLVISSILTAMSGWVEAHWPDALLYVFHVLNFIVSFAVVSVLFALMFKYLPDAKVQWRHVWMGALFTSLLFVIGKTALGLYFGKAEPGSAYGAAGSIILILLWVSYSSMILFFGAEFTRAYADLHDGEVKASGLAKKVKGRGKDGDV